MKAKDIARIIANHILKRGDLDDILSTSDRSEAAMDFLDLAINAKRTGIMNDLEGLKSADAEEIYKAFKTFGRFETMVYLDAVAGSRELAGHAPLYMAAFKLGNPDADWKDVKEQAEKAHSLDLTNPQMLIDRTYAKEMKTAIAGIQYKEAKADTLPYVSDRLYLNSILTTNTNPYRDTGKALKVGGGLIEHALERCEQSHKPLTVDDELRLAGILALGCMTLPGFDPYGHGVTAKTTMRESLESARNVCATKGTEEQVGQISKVVARVIKQTESGSTLFKTPVGLAISIYNHDLAEKVVAALRPEKSPISFEHSRLIS